MIRQLLAAGMLFGLAACVTTQPYEAAGIDYKLPRTDAKVTLDLDVVQCTDPTDDATDQVAFTSTFKIDPIASAQDQVYHLSGADLLSSTTKRSITVDVDVNGVISSVNSTATDQTAAILGDVVKIAATVAAAAAPGEKSSKFVCKTATKTYLALVGGVQTQIAAKLAALPKAADQAAAQKEIDDLATRLAAYKAKLHAETTALFKIEKTYEGQQIEADTTSGLGTRLVFDPEPLSTLFDTFESGPGAKGHIDGVNADDEHYIATTAFYVRNASGTALGGQMADAPNSCNQYMLVPAGRAITVVLKRESSAALGTPDPANLAVTTSGRIIAPMVASQLDKAAKLCVSAGFGENRTLSLKFDSYGRTTEFTYAPDSRAANVASALAGAAPDVSSTVTSITSHKLAQEKNELDQLQTEQSLVKARVCQEAMDAGATSCPSN